jgi:hypothetical protein
MKYGILVHATTMNLGDDVQAYAAAKLMPRYDYIVPREEIDTFRTEHGEPVGVVMNAWWMIKKWRWPPAPCIYPLMTSMHVNKNGIQERCSPVGELWMEGLGGDYFRAYGPVGCRDQQSVDAFLNQGIEAYFSGCLTLTLPKQKTTPDAGT